MGRIIAEAAALPVALAEVKAYLRVVTSDEDALIAGLARAAADMCEAFTGRALIDRAVAERLAASASWTRLGAAPVRAIEGVAALGADGSVTALAAGAFAIDIDAGGEGWVRVLDAGPSTGSGRAVLVRVSYRAGMAADPNGLPEALRHGILRLTAHLYTQRERGEDIEPPAAVTALWRPWRRLRLK